MLIIAFRTPRALLRTLHQPSSFSKGSLPRSLRSHIPPPRNFIQQHASSMPKSTLPKTAQQQAKAAAQSSKQYDIPERLIIYHAGTGRITFLAMMKLTSLIIGAFFTFLVIPGYAMSDKPLQETAAVTLCGIIPLLFIAYTTSPFVTHIHIHLPPAARASRSVLERFIRALPPSTNLTFTTMSLIAKPRYSSLAAGDLAPAVRGRRFGLVNYVRDTEAENASRKWYNHRAVGKFYIQDQSGGASQVTHQKRGRDAASVVDSWIWDAVREKVAKRAGIKNIS